MPGGPEMPAFEPELPRPKDRIPIFGGKRTLTILIVGGLIVILGVTIAKFMPMCVGSDCRIITAHKVAAAAAGGVAGSYTVDKGGFFDLFWAIHSDGKSGACLFVDSGALKLPAAASPPGNKCTSHSQCGDLLKNDPTDPSDDAFEGWEGLCSSGSCWIRPGKGLPTSDVCNKGIAATDGVPVESNKPPFDLRKIKGILQESAKNKPINVLILACLNGKFTPGTTPPCGGGVGETRKSVSDPEGFLIP